jgi:beta-barrel assembly-enhancing protease
MSPPGRGPTLENRLPAEGINSSDEHPLREFAWLIGAGLVTLAVVVLLVGWGARWLAPRLPFATEVALAQRWLDKPAAPQHAARSAALQALAERVAAAMALPPGMTLVVSYEPGPIVNAYATLGGRIRVFEGLLRKLPSEDALAALLAHEVAHVKQRHVAANAGRGVALALLLGLVSADAGAAAAHSLLGNVTSLALLGYSREQESEADAAALAAVVALYGHAGGMLELFSSLGAAAPDKGPPIEMLRSHPLTAERIEAIRAHAVRAGWPLTGAQRTMPPALAPGTAPAPP